MRQAFPINYLLYRNVIDTDFLSLNWGTGKSTLPTYSIKSKTIMYEIGGVKRTLF